MNSIQRSIMVVIGLILCSAALAQQPGGKPLLLKEQTLATTDFLTAHEHDVAFHKGDANYNSIACASDGKVYYTISVHQKDEYGQMYVFDPENRQTKHLADFGDVVGENKFKTIPQGKCHVGIFEHKGSLYTAIMQGFYLTPQEIKSTPDLEGYSPYLGGHFIAYDLNSGAFTDLARAPQDEGIITMAVDQGRNRLYGLTHAGGLFVYYDLETGLFQNVERVFKEDERICRTLAVDPRQGDVYWTNTQGDIMVFRYAAGKIETLTKCSLRDPAFANEDAWRTIVWYPAEKAFYGLHKSNNYLFKFDPEAETVEPVRGISTAACQAKKGAHSGPCDVSALGLALGPAGHTLYYLAIGPGIETADGRRLPTTVNFITYHLPTRQYTDHGTLRLADGRYPFFAQCMAASGGAIYTVAWVEVPERDADLYAKVKAAKSPVLEPDQPVSQMNLVSFPDPYLAR